ncbi:T9SS type A sorting domain-containing protein [Hymenobacter saemangeumensis]|uniref:T9SS type A sorting domain-containing protein n=1 Tax=Hymenobacter saemangeumensis TaxID=1084522 RepID=UPI0031EDF0D9
MYNSQGQLMYTAKKGRHSTTVDTRSWPAGLYYLHTQTANGLTRCRVQVEHR